MITIKASVFFLTIPMIINTLDLFSVCLRSALIASQFWLPSFLKEHPFRCRFRGGGGGPLSGWIPCRPKGCPFCTILRYPYLVTDPKIFLKAPSAPIYINFEGRARADKA